MHKYLILLLVPFTFIILLGTSLDFFNNNFNKNTEKINSIVKKDLVPINVHKNFKITKKLDNFFNINEKIYTISQIKVNLVSAQENNNITSEYDSLKINKIYSEKFIDKDIYISTNQNIQISLKKNTANKTINHISSFEENNNITSEYDSLKINKIYSEKFIDKDISTNQNIQISLKKNTANKTIDNISSFSAPLVSSDWKKMFSLKKIEFIETVLPLISFENQKILMERQRLIKIKNYLLLEKTLIKNDIIYLKEIAKKYQIKSKNKHKIDLLNDLLFSVDVIPNSIVLAQAANESGWGTSRFAKEYNALFGQYTYDENNGVVPFEREEGKKHLVRNFSSFHKSVESYFKNINTHYAYQRFRKVRSQINKKDLNKNIELLTQTLDVYAEDDSYVDTINSIIDSNNFSQFDFKIQAFINS